MSEFDAARAILFPSSKYKGSEEKRLTIDKSRIFVVAREVLTTEEYIVFRWRMKGESNKAIAKQMGVTLEEVAAYYSAALRRLRQEKTVKRYTL